ncbi:MAG: AAA family ATPase, partial [Flavobacteriales bacterium]
HPDVFNLLLQILDDGLVTDSLGRKVNFKNTIIIMTSNIGARQLKEFGQGVGFSTAARKAEADNHSKVVIQSALKKSFAPEFLNRIDDVMIFNSLSKEDIHTIIDIELEGLYKRTLDLGFTVEISELAKDFIADKGYDAAYGARPLARAIQKYIEDPLAEEIINSRLVEGDLISIKLNDKKDEIKIEIVKPKKG